MATQSDSPLVQAVKAGDHVKAQNLMLKGASFAEKTGDGRTAYDVAMESGNAQMIDVFKAHLACG